LNLNLLQKEDIKLVKNDIGGADNDAGNGRSTFGPQHSGIGSR
jgi:hypothetical protein